MNTAVQAAESSALSHADELTQVLHALIALRRGDATVRLPYGGSGVFGRIAEVYNDLVERSAVVADEFARVSQVVGKEGKLSRRAAVPDARGIWAKSVESINSLIDDLVHPTSEVARVIGAGDQSALKQNKAVEVEGRPHEGALQSTAKTVNPNV